MNSANYKTVRSALDCLPRCGLRVDKELLTQLRNESFLALSLHTTYFLREVCRSFRRTGLRAMQTFPAYVEALAAEYC